MSYFNKFKGTKGFISTWERVLRFRYIIQEKAKQKCRILAFWEKHGTEATEEAFKVKKRTLFHWKKKLKEGSGKLEALNDGNRAPKKRRKRLWNIRMIEEIKRIRSEHPNLGKDKIYPLLLPFCDNLNLPCPKEKTIGRLIKDLGGLRLYPKKLSHFGRERKVNRQKVPRKPKDFKTTHIGHLVALDTVERFVFGLRRYIITFEDIHSRFGFAWATTSHASKAAEEFFNLCLKVFPYPIEFVLTDNGSEFKKHFAKRLKELHLIHYHTYPKTPKMNAHCERFNRTLQEEFVDYHANLLLNVEEFNRKLMDYLIFYNTDRVHCAFKNKLSPVQFMLQSPYYPLTRGRECKTGWPYTIDL
ncbi:MAG: DDE-type integrase/transposase/recombinase [Patescibacteria group bacterium]|nr:DDE-type integrase/transposase/recombinase [Patescibacteria group bacterium]